jgi:hypothetical protein
MNKKTFFIMVFFLCLPLALAITSSKPTITVTFSESVDVNSINKELLNESGDTFEIIEIFRSEDNTSFRYKPTYHLSEGNYIFYIQAKDRYGNLGELKSIEFTVVLPPMVIKLLQPKYSASSTDIFDIMIWQSRESLCRWSRYDVDYFNMDFFDVNGGNYSVLYDFDMSGKTRQEFYVICNDTVRRELVPKYLLLEFDNSPPYIMQYSASPNPIVEPPVSSTITVKTDEVTICKYDRDQPIFEYMEGNFTGFDGGNFLTTHTQKLDNLLIAESPYTFYVKCMNKAELITQTDDYVTITIDLGTSLQITNVYTPEYSKSRSVALNLSTNKNAQCYYTRTASSTPNIKFTTTGAKQHTEIMQNLQDGAHTFYILCKNTDEQATTQIGFIIDITPPDMIYVNDTGPIFNNSEKTFYTNQLKGKWLANDTQSGILEYHYFVLDSATNTVLASGVTTDEEDWVTNLQLQNGQKYYFKVFAVNRVGIASLNKSSDGITVDTSLEPVTCTDKKQNGGETAVDCGGSCPGCPTGYNCSTDNDCSSKYCNSNNKCATPTCSDKILNGDETDTDCGGDDCEPCSDGNDCETDSDCESNNCDMSTRKCSVKIVSCKNGVIDTNEADVDCGGVCKLKCNDGSSCTKDSDCNSRKCVKNVCCGPGDFDCDGTPNDNDEDQDGDGIPNDEDPDDDNDGLCDTANSHLNNPSICTGNDDDDDNDGIPDSEDPDKDGDSDDDGIPNDQDDDIDGDGIPNWEDPDDDNDGLCDTANSHLNDPKICTGSDPDDDGDGVLDQDESDSDNDQDNDGIPNDEDSDIDGDDIPNDKDPDDDNDGLCDTANSPLNDNSCGGVDPNADNDNDGETNVNDDDIDGDGILNNDDPDIDGDGTIDQFEDAIGNDPHGDIDGDGTENIDDEDIDGDGISNGNDADVNGDGEIDNPKNLFDDDIDNDGIPNVEDDDIDGDGILNGDDPDVDGDGTVDQFENSVGNDPNGDKDTDSKENINDEDVDNDDISNGNDPDIDGDGVPDQFEDAIGNDAQGDIDSDGKVNIDDEDMDGDGILNDDDPDVDGDGIVDQFIDAIKNKPEGDIDKDGKLNINDEDMDGDGILNGKDPDVNGDGIIDQFKKGSRRDPHGDMDEDNKPNVDDADMDGDGIANSDDPDMNGDGILDQFENAIGDDPLGDIDKDGKPNIDDDDIDGDGILNGKDPDVNGDGIVDNLFKGNQDGDDNADGVKDPGDTDLLEQWCYDPQTKTAVKGTCSSLKISGIDVQDGDLDNDGKPNFLDDDVDGDGITNDKDPDDDNDGLCDVANSPLNDNSCSGEDLDDDNDGIPDTEEDSDADGLPNSWELKYGLDPNKMDSDGDGIPDGEEDLDKDGLKNKDEYKYKTNPLQADSDGDGHSDGEEVTKGTDPLDSSSLPASQTFFYLIVFLAVAFVLGGGYFAYMKISEIKQFSKKETMVAPGGLTTLSGGKNPVDQLAKQKEFKPETSDQSILRQLPGRAVQQQKSEKKITPGEMQFKKKEKEKSEQRKEIFEAFGDTKLPEKKIGKKVESKTSEEKIKPKPQMDIEEYYKLTELTHDAFKKLKGVSEKEFKKLTEGKTQEEIRRILNDIASKQSQSKDLSLLELEVQKYIDLSDINEYDFRKIEQFSLPEIRILFKDKTEVEVKKVIEDISKETIQPKKAVEKEDKPEDIFSKLPKKETEEQRAFNKLHELKQQEKIDTKQGKDVFSQLSEIVGKESAEKLAAKPAQTFEKLSSIIEENKLAEKPANAEEKKDAFSQLLKIVGKRSAEQILSSKPQTFEKLNKLIKDKKLNEKDVFKQLSDIQKKQTQEPGDVFKKLRTVKKKDEK